MPNELHTITNDMNKMNYWCDVKSSIDPVVVLEGSPYGGVGMICKIPGVCYISLSTDNDRISAMQIAINEKVYLTVIGMYMPHYDGNVNQIAQYNQTLEDVQCIIDCIDPSPLMFLRDMNVVHVTCGTIN